MVRFAHLADCHVGAWRDPRLRALADEAFEKAMSEILAADVDFAIIAGDLFNTALPGIDHVNHVVKQLGRLKAANIPVYLIAGSHDYSPTGKTMLSVLESAGLCIDVFKGEVRDEQLHLEFTTDEKTGVKLTGILGKAGQLDAKLYKTLSTEDLELPGGTKIFLFHTTLDELKPKGWGKVESQPVSFLPKGFDYYAGGHVHIVGSTSLPGYKDIVYPGPLFPASFSELEELDTGGLYIVDNASGQFEKTRVEIVTKKTFSVVIDCTNKTPKQVQDELSETLSANIADRIVLVRLKGRLASGAAADIDFRNLFADCQSRGAYACLKNTVAVSSPEFREVQMKTAASEEIEAEIISEHVGQIPVASWSEAKEKKLFHDLLSTLASQQHEGETKTEYEDRVIGSGKNLLDN